MSYDTVQRADVSPGQIVERLVRYDGPPEQFLLQLLATQCRVGNAEHGAILRTVGGEGGSQIEVLSIFPQLEEQTAPVWLSQAVEAAPQVINSRKPVTTAVRTPDDMYGSAPSRFLVLLPIWGKAGVRGVEAFVIPNSGPVEVENSVKRLELTVTLLSLYELRLTVQRRGSDLQRLRKACEVLAAVNDQKRYKAAAIAFANHVAGAFNAERVGIGLLRGRYVKLQTLSHTEKFTRKMELVQSIESTMEESLDQDAEVMFPAPPDASTVNRSAKELSQRSGNTIVLSFPLRLESKPVGVLTIERSSDEMFEIEEVEAIRVTCDLCTARIVELSENDRWFGAKLEAKTKKGLKLLVGPKHTWIKATGLAFILFILFVTFVKGTFKVDSSFIIEAQERQVIAAPFNGILEDVHVRPGDTVVANETVLATFDTLELQKQLLITESRLKSKDGEANLLRAENKLREYTIALEEATTIRAEIDQLQYNLSQATIKSPVSGLLMIGDLKKEIGGPKERGQMLFEVAPNELEAEMSIPEDQIADVAVGQTGVLAAVSHPGDYLKFTVKSIDPVAEVVEQANIFKVRVSLDEPRPWLRPGMEGIAKIDVDKRPYGLIWTRELVNWIRMKLWI